MTPKPRRNGARRSTPGACAGGTSSPNARSRGTTPRTRRPPNRSGGGPTKSCDAAIGDWRNCSAEASCSRSSTPNSRPAARWRAPRTGWRAGVNSPLKRMLLDHHGLPEEHMRRACEWVCYMKSGSPDPKSLIRAEHWRPAKPSPVEEGANDGNGAPKYGTGISWDEFHTHAGWRANDQ